MKAIWHGNRAISKEAGEVLLSANTYNTALAMPQVTQVATQTAAGSGIGGIDTQGLEQLDLIFFGTDTQNETFSYQVIAEVPIIGTGGQGFTPVRIATGAVTLGATALGSLGTFISAATDLVADTITETSSSDWASVHSPANDLTAVLRLNVARWRHVYVRVTRDGGTAATMGVLAVLGEKFSPLWENVAVTLNASDIEIGAVELKDGGSDNRAAISAGGVLSVGGAVTVTGTVTANAGTNLNTSTLALEAGGNLATVKTNTDPLVASGGGGYVRQDSTATIAKEAGGNLASLLTAINAMRGSTLTFSSVAVSAAAARQNIAYGAAKFARLHSIVGTMNVAGTLAIESADDAAGTNAVVLCTAFNLDAKGGLVIPFTADPNGCLKTTAAGKYLNLVTVTGTFTGFAVTSLADA